MGDYNERLDPAEVIHSHMDFAPDEGPSAKLALERSRDDEYFHRDETTPPSLSQLTRTTLAMILAGGRGSRLGPLTDWRCKPAVPFGGKFRIVDFALSNCV